MSVTPSPVNLWMTEPIFKKEASWASERFWTAWREKKILPISGFEPRTLRWLHCHGFGIVNVLVLLDVMSVGWKRFHNVIHSLRNLSHSCPCCRATRNLWLHNAPSYHLCMFHWNSLSRSLNEEARFMTRWRLGELAAPYRTTQRSSHARKMSQH